MSMKNPVYPGAVIREDCLENLGLIFFVPGFRAIGWRGSFLDRGLS